MIHPTYEVLTRWRDAFTTDRDIWYWDDDPLPTNLDWCEVLSRSDYLAHPTYSGIEYVNAYWHWRMPKRVQHVLVCDQDWIGSLPDDARDMVLAKQIELDRGMVVPSTHFDLVPDIMQPYIVDEKIIISRAAWISLSQSDQFAALKRELLLWDDLDCLPIPDGIPEHIRAIANTFGDSHGANCLATTAYCITGQESIRHRWMFKPEMVAVLDDNRFQPVDEIDAKLGDVVAFTRNGTIVHAAYCVGMDRFINKTGQSMFNPIRIVNRAMLNADWPDEDVTLYRQRPS